MLADLEPLAQRRETATVRARVQGKRRTSPLMLAIGVVVFAVVVILGLLR